MPFVGDNLFPGVCVIRLILSPTSRCACVFSRDLVTCVPYIHSLSPYIPSPLSRLYDSDIAFPNRQREVIPDRAQKLQKQQKQE